MENQIRVLHVTTVLAAAGIESFIMNMYRNMDRTQVQFDFMVMRDEKEFYDDEIASMGGKKHTISIPTGNTLLRILKESRALYRFLKANRYQIVHIHYTTPLRAPYLWAAKKAGVSVRIYHSHSAEVSGKSKGKLWIYDYFRKKITDWSTHRFACSEAAAKWMYSSKVFEHRDYRVICNGIDVERFRFDRRARDEVRAELGLGDAYVIVHTGRFLEQKNHRFIIEVFRTLKQRCPKAKLLLLGKGELLEEMKALVESCSLREDVHFLGVRSDVERILSASDCYLMPSLYEGLPVAAVEAECAGLPCVFSENITKEVALTKKTAFLSLKQPVSEWCDQLLAYRDVIREDCSGEVAAKGYSIQNGAKALQAFYLSSLS